MHFIHTQVCFKVTQDHTSCCYAVTNNNSTLLLFWFIPKSKVKLLISIFDL